MAFNEITGQALRDYDRERAAQQPGVIQRTPAAVGQVAQNQGGAGNVRWDGTRWSSTTAPVSAASRPNSVGYPTAAPGRSLAEQPKPGVISRPQGTGAPAQRYGVQAVSPVQQARNVNPAGYVAQPAPAHIAAYGDIGTQRDIEAQIMQGWGVGQLFVDPPPANLPSILQTPVQMANNASPATITREQAQNGGVTYPAPVYNGPISNKVADERTGMGGNDMGGPVGRSVWGDVSGAPGNAATGSGGVIPFPNTDATGRAPGSAPGAQGAGANVEPQFRPAPTIQRTRVEAPPRVEPARRDLLDMPEFRNPYEDLPGFDQQEYRDRFVAGAVGNIQRGFADEAQRIREDAALRGLSQQGQGAIERSALTRAGIQRGVAMGTARNQAETQAQQYGREDAFKRAAGIQQGERDRLNYYETMAKLPAQLTALDLANESTSLAINQVRDTYPDLVRKIQAGADLTEEEVKQARWIRDNASTLAAQGFFANIAPAIIRGGAALMTGGVL